MHQRYLLQNFLNTFYILEIDFISKKFKLSLESWIWLRHVLIQIFFLLLFAKNDEMGNLTSVCQIWLYFKIVIQIWKWMSYFCKKYTIGQNQNVMKCRTWFQTIKYQDYKTTLVAHNFLKYEFRSAWMRFIFGFVLRTLCQWILCNGVLSISLWNVIMKWNVFSCTNFD